MAVIGELVVNLKAQTAEFTDSLGKSNTLLVEFGKDGEEAGRKMGTSMGEARGGLMLAEESLGVRLPRHLTGLIATIPGVGAAFATMLPLLGVIMAIEIIEKLIVKSQEAKDKMAESNAAAAHGVAEVFNGLNEKLLSVQKRSDELSGDHLAVLRDVLKEIDNASLKELEGAFEHLTKDALTQLKDIKGAWYELTLGTSGQAHALTEFKDKYQAALDSGKVKEAGELLAGTTAKAKEYLEAQKSVLGTSENWTTPADIERQKVLVQALENTATAAQKVAQVGAGEKANAKEGEAQAEAARQYAIYEAQQRGLEQRRRAEAKYAEERKKVIDKAAKEDIQIEEAEARATEAVMESCQKVQRALEQEQLRMTIETAQQQNKAEDESAQHKLKMRKSTIAEEVKAEQDAAKRMHDTETAAYNQELVALNSAGIKDVVAIQKLENQKLKAEQKYQDERNKIAHKGEEQYANLVKQAQEKSAAAVSRSVNEMLFQHQSMAQSFKHLGQEMVEGAIENAVKMVLTNDMTKLSNARVAASNAMKDYPFPANIAIAGAVFATTLAFAKGGEVPGYGSGDTVPAMLTPGETVVTKALTEQVKNSDGSRGNTTTHNTPIHMHIHAVDAAGFEGLIKKHSSMLQKHVTSAVRRANR